MALVQINHSQSNGQTTFEENKTEPTILARKLPVGVIHSRNFKNIGLKNVRYLHFACVCSSASTSKKCSKMLFKQYILHQVGNTWVCK
ncbi:hypothetical protein KR51_00007120 [Rubidibacter lacunae KORDI 51-2]|uniref:Uncharacterized protein n=1 Tax=Rubidibacter lacunae KORDI 51-2 TaxID=582515 RepID=U5DDN6_9CHRO|nr:hypothetical protein KR51_00007120 [Rubidibacter lacunae KORDI 51-2]